MLSRYKAAVFIEDNIKLDDPSTMIKAKLKIIKERLLDFDQKAQKGVSVLDVELGQTYDLMSGCIEDYVEKEILKGIIGRYRPNIRMESISDLKSIDQQKIDNAANIYGKTSRYGTRHSQPEGAPRPSLEQLQKDFQQLETTLK